MKDGEQEGNVGTVGSVYLRQVRKEDLTGASSQNVPVTPRHKLLTVFFKYLWEWSSRSRVSTPPNPPPPEENFGFQ